MTDNKSNGYSDLDDDVERDMGAKGGPTTTLGKPDDNHEIPHPYNDDIQTKLAAKSTENKKQNNKNSSTTKSGI